MIDYKFKMRDNYFTTLIIRKLLIKKIASVNVIVSHITIGIL